MPVPSLLPAMPASSHCCVMSAQLQAPPLRLPWPKLSELAAMWLMFLAFQVGLARWELGTRMQSRRCVTQGAPA